MVDSIMKNLRELRESRDLHIEALDFMPDTPLKWAAIRLINGESVTEVATSLSLNPNTLKTRVFRDVSRGIRAGMAQKAIDSGMDDSEEIYSFYDSGHLSCRCKALLEAHGVVNLGDARKLVADLHVKPGDKTGQYIQFQGEDVMNFGRKSFEELASFLGRYEVFKNG